MANKKEESIAKEIVNEKIDVELLKKELTDYVDEKIRNELVENIEKANKKVIREKNYKILWRDLIVVILLCACGFLVYTLYDINYFDKSKTNDSITVNNNEVENNTNNKEETVAEPTLDELKEKYSYLLDKLIINDESNYVEDYYKGNLSNELKNYLTLNLIDFTSLTTQDDYNIISELSFSEKYKELFLDEYTNVNFDYNGNLMRYIGVINSYLSSNILVKTTTNINREIIAIEVNNNDIKITTVEGIIKDGKLFNPLTQEEVTNYNNDNLANYENDLVKLVYLFSDEKLKSIN